MAKARTQTEFDESDANDARAQPLPDELREKLLRMIEVSCFHGNELRCLHSVQSVFAEARQRLLASDPHQRPAPSSYVSEHLEDQRVINLLDSLGVLTVGQCQQWIVSQVCAGVANLGPVQAEVILRTMRF